MRHLDETELVDFVERQLPAIRAEHVEDCDVCRARVETIASALIDVHADEGYEPSPLFWDHFGARVSDAVRAEPPAPPPLVWQWVRNPATAWATCASIAVLLMVTALWRATLHAPIPRGTSGPMAPLSVATAVAGTSAEAPEADAAWALVSAAADDLAWEDVRAAGIIAHPGSAEGVAMELTADERAELARLLEAEMKRSGAS
jgi:hypothetical protein